jgi:hypothetical protein
VKVHPANSIMTSVCYTIHLLWNPEFHDRIYRSPPVDAVLSPHPHAELPKIQFETLLPCTPRFFVWVLSFRFWDWNGLCILISHACYIARQSRPWYYHPKNWRRGKVVKLIMQFYPSFCYVLCLRNEYFHQSSLLETSLNCVSPLAQRAEFHTYTE